jgi:hypothetical protein
MAKTIDFDGSRWTVLHLLTVPIDAAIEIVSRDSNGFAEPVDRKLAPGDHAPHMFARYAEFFGNIMDREKAADRRGGRGIRHLLRLLLEVRGHIGVPDGGRALMVYTRWPLTCGLSGE